MTFIMKCLWNNQRYNITFRTLILALIRNDFHYEVWHEITFTFPNFNGTQRCNLWSLKMGVISSHTLLGVWLHAISLHNEKIFWKAYPGISKWVRARSVGLVGTFWKLTRIKLWRTLPPIEHTPMSSYRKSRVHPRVCRLQSCMPDCDSASNIVL